MYDNIINLGIDTAREFLDADIYGPSQPQMFGIHQKPESKDGKSMEPLNSNNIQIT
ncbi:MAG: P-loop NTPase [Candidatus Kapaibacteriota bacterium]